jgi:very-short-patch-repair endonuclease/predicted transcriptional regulator of viral defense system
MGSSHATSTPDAVIAQIAFTQHGVVTFQQLRDAGLGVGAINLRVRNQRLHRLHRGVFAVGHARISREGRWLAAVLALGDGAVLSHMSAAALWGIRHSNSTDVHVTVPTAAGRARRRGIVVHRSLTLAPADVDEQAAIAVTSVSRTLLDLAGVLAPGRLERAVERSLAARQFDLNAVQAVLSANPRRHGATALAQIVARIHDEPSLTRQELEALMLDLCDAHRMQRPEVNVLVDGLEVDFLWRARRLIVETDGREFHETPIAFARDRERDERLTVLGFRVVRFTYRRLVNDPAAVAATLRALLA